MFRWVLGLDAFVARTRPAWAWLGQVALVLLGVHLAADRLDDGISAALVASGIHWPEPEQPLTLGTWSAVLFELYVAAWIGVAAVRATEAPARSAREWWSRWSPHNVAAPLVWAPTVLAGAWVIGMETEDLVAGIWAPGASVAGWLVAALAVFRLGWPSLLRVTRCAPVPGHRWDGALTVWPAVVVAALAVRYGLPVWGWLP
ncbi:MAG: hypothetical protein R3F59_24770 [Myxococcota bacterium]